VGEVPGKARKNQKWRISNNIRNTNKQDIIAMEPIITGFRLGTEQVIQVRGAELD
jgi:hypothetical protein